MKIDVTDLFDSLFSIAVRAHCEFFGQAEAHTDFDQWNAFCQDLSDTHFLTLVARRAFVVTHVQIPVPAIKRRIITQSRVGPRGELLNMWYEGPRFFCFPDQPSAFAAHFVYENRESVLDRIVRPDHRLTLHLGRVPALQPPVEIPRYEADRPLRWFCEHGFETMFGGPVRRLLENRGDWTLREVRLFETPERREWNPPRWKQTEHLEVSSQEVFENMWTMAAGRESNSAPRPGD